MELELKIKPGDFRTLLLLREGEVWKEVSKSLFFSELKKISPGEILEAFPAIEARVGKRYALYLLSRRAMLSSDLESKLVAKGISEKAAQGIVEYCKEKGFLDDTQEIARIVAKEQRKGFGARAIQFKLRQKGVVLRNLEGINEEEAVSKWIEKLAKRIDWSDRNAANKLIAKLMRRGFSSEVVINSVNDYKNQHHANRSFRD